MALCFLHSDDFEDILISIILKYNKLKTKYVIKHGDKSTSFKC